ncbi:MULTISPECIES: hypothetical protein [unclassified Streptomyces]
MTEPARDLTLATSGALVHTSAELIGAVAALVALGILTLASVRSIGRR